MLMKADISLHFPKIVKYSYIIARSVNFSRFFHCPSLSLFHSEMEYNFFVVNIVLLYILFLR